MIKYIVSLRTQQVEGKAPSPSVFVSETTQALFGDRSKSANLGEAPLEFNEEKMTDVRMRTYKFLG